MSWREGLGDRLRLDAGHVPRYSLGVGVAVEPAAILRRPAHPGRMLIRGEGADCRGSVAGAKRQTERVRGHFPDRAW